MRNFKPTDLAPATERLSPVSAAINRVVAIAPAPLLPGEKQADYAEMAARIVRAAKPGDAIEEFLIRDVIDLIWEILRLRRVKSGILNSSMNAGVSEILKGLGHGPQSALFYLQRLGEKWAAGDKDARKEVEAALTKAGLTIDDVVAKTLEKKLDSFERLDRMLASAEARRNNALREIDRHRDALGGGVRRSIEEIEDAEFRDVETGKTGRGRGSLTSERQRRANLANAKTSKGPKTRAGKARSARNSLRHGLSIPVCKEPSLSIQAEEIALKLAGPDPDGTLLDRARDVGEAQVDLNRVRARRNSLVAQLLADPKFQPLSAYRRQDPKIQTIQHLERTLGMSFGFDDIEPLIELKPLEGDEKFDAVMEDRIRELAALDRYERRAISKRKFAIRALDCLLADRRAIPRKMSGSTFYI